ncbi:hypothetical protein GCK32_017789, partial [Trichostrongylus colubriformis]
MHAFSVAATMVDPTSSPQLNTACSMFKTWAHHLDDLFFSEKHEASALSRGLPAINCYIEAARVENETRARKYIARLPQLMTELQERPSCGFTAIVQRIASAYPLQILSALRPLLDPALIDGVIEAVARNVPVPSLSDDHECSALVKVLENACRTRLTDVRV